MRNIILTFLIVLLTFPVAFAEPELKGSLSELSAYVTSVSNYVTLSGQSEVKVQADRAIVSIRVVTEDRSLHKALKSNQDLRETIFNTLKKSGISADKISASRFSSTPQYGFFAKKPSSYKVENLVKITIKDEKEFQEVSKIVDSFKEVDYEGIGFEHSNKDELKRKAIERACDAVIKKKEIYEKKFGVKLTPKKFVEGPVYDESGTRITEAFGRGVAYSLQMDKEPEPPSSVMVGPSPFGEITFHGNIYIEYYIESQEQ